MAFIYSSIKIIQGDTERTLCEWMEEYPSSCCVKRPTIAENALHNLGRTHRLCLIISKQLGRCLFRRVLLGDQVSDIHADAIAWLRPGLDPAIRPIGLALAVSGDLRNTGPECTSGGMRCGYPVVRMGKIKCFWLIGTRFSVQRQVRYKVEALAVN